MAKLKSTGEADVAAPAGAPPVPGKQAVVLIHGMGEQIPMDTIKSFVSTLWEHDPSVAAPRPAGGGVNPVWSKPDERTGSLELRRLTTQESLKSQAFPRGVRTDFYELYWADLTAGSTWDQFVGWVRYLLFRPLSKVPRDVRSAWFALWFASLVVVGLGALALVPEAVWTAHMPAWLPRALVVAAAGGLLVAIHRVAAQTFGRVVRYTRADPDNVAARAAVRARGLALLRALHADATYSRVVVVGHSLGTILAYDLVSYFWAEQDAARTVEEGTPTFEAFRKVEGAAATLGGAQSSATRSAFIAAQTEFRRQLWTRTTRADVPRRRWLISDLVTLGSPLTHAEFLLAKDDADLSRRQTGRELPCCPPVRESLDAKVKAKAISARLVAPGQGDGKLMAYPGKAPKSWILHHAAPFAAVRWTNVFDPSRLVFQGDVISGPLATHFGPAVTDVNLAQIDRQATSFSHTRYWDLGQSDARVTAVRKAVNLLDQ